MTETSVWRERFVRAGGTRFLVRTWVGPGDTPGRAPVSAIGAARRTVASAVDDGGGDGRPLALLLHGWPQDGTCWRAVAPQLAAAGYRVVCPDLKGFGRSDAPRRGYDPGTLADEISQLIRALDARKAVLIGHDWGGAVALATAFRHPGRVKALVLASSPFRQIDLTAAWHIPLLNVPVVPQVAFKFAGRALTRAAIDHSAVVHDPFTDEAVRRYGAAVAQHPTGWLNYYRHLSRRAVWDWAVRRVKRRTMFLPEPDEPHRLRVPSLVIWGEDDPVTPHHLAVRVAHDLDTRLVSIPGVGHFVHEESVDAFVEATLGLLGPADEDDDERATG